MLGLVIYIPGSKVVILTLCELSKVISEFFFFFFFSDKSYLSIISLGMKGDMACTLFLPVYKGTSTRHAKVISRSF